MEEEARFFFGIYISTVTFCPIAPASHPSSLWSINRDFRGLGAFKLCVQTKFCITTTCLITPKSCNLNLIDNSDHIIHVETICKYPVGLC